MAFDIHTYGDQLVSRLPQHNEWCPFSELVAGQPAFEVCRFMLHAGLLATGKWPGTQGMGQHPWTLLTPCFHRLMTIEWGSLSSQDWRQLWTQCL